MKCYHEKILDADGKSTCICYTDYEVRQYGINWELAACDCNGKMRTVKIYKEKKEAEEALNEKLG